MTKSRSLPGRAFAPRGSAVWEKSRLALYAAIEPSPVPFRRDLAGFAGGVAKDFSAFFKLCFRVRTGAKRSPLFLHAGQCLLCLEEKQRRFFLLQAFLDFAPLQRQGDKGLFLRRAVNRP